jgi:hypothetical protein
MNVRFIAPDPRQRARPILDAVLAAGTEQIAIACAFLTSGGVELLKRHANRLRLAPSFVVVAWEPPTILETLNELYALIPGKVYVHLGSLTPVERGVGAGLMHSKVFFAKAGNQCQLWTGSHNLTASAMQGVNREAAVLIEGTFNEPVFADALAHLNQCRAEAMLFDPLNPPPPQTTEQTLVIHAECHTALKTMPWYVHLRPENTDYDKAMRPPAAVCLYLYDPGSLHLGRSRPTPTAVYSGTLTALNFTEHHPQYRGISADWSAANYVIEINHGIPCLMESRPHSTTPSQGVFRVEANENRNTVWLTESPEPKLERVVGARNVSEIDPEYRKFFTKSSLEGRGLVHQEYRSLKTTVRVPRKEVGNVESLDLQAKLGMSDRTELLIDETMDQEDKFAFIYRAKYRA